MSLSNDIILNTLKNHFVCGFKNIKDEPYAGRSGQHDPNSAAVVTTNGAGPHNVQLFFLDKDGTVLHCLPGYWAPGDLLEEMKFATSLDRLYKMPNLSLEEKKRRYTLAQLNALRYITPDMVQRSPLQRFDAKREQQNPNSGFHVKPGGFVPMTASKQGNLKTTIQVVHERMSQRPFVPYEKFDVAEFTDYGKQRYDKKEQRREEMAQMGFKKK